VILVLDAEVKAARKLVRQLEANGFRAAATSTHPGALAALARMYYHALVVAMDVELKRELERLLKLRRAAPRTWIIVASAHGDDLARRRVYRRGGDALVSLPFSLKELRSHLAAFTARSRGVI
jgi:DNA-binding response OmpR family regulator